MKKIIFTVFVILCSCNQKLPLEKMVVEELKNTPAVTAVFNAKP